MPRRLKRLSGEQVVAALLRHGFAEVSRRGSHAKLRRVGSDGKRQTIVVPVHLHLATGTLGAIVREASRYLSAQQIAREFYTR